MPPRKDAASFGGGLVVALLGGVPGRRLRRGGRRNRAAGGHLGPLDRSDELGSLVVVARKRRTPPTQAGRGRCLPSGGQTVSTSVGVAISDRTEMADWFTMLASTRASISRTSPVVTRGNGASHSGRLRGFPFTGARVLIPAA